MANWMKVDADQLNADLTSVADSIRERAGTSEPLVFPEGFKSAVEGIPNHYDEFWDAYQDEGQRTNYANGFSGHGWNNVTFKPKHDIRPTYAPSIFIDSRTTGDISEILQSCGVELDFSNCTNMNMAFQNSTLTGVGVVNVSSCTNLNQCFAYCSIDTIGKIIVSETTVFNSNTFSGAYYLANLAMEGVLASTISFAQCGRFSLESAKSVIGCLKNFTGTGNEATKTISFHANTWTLLDADGNAAPNGNTWRDYIVSDLRWNI